MLNISSYQGKFRWNYDQGKGNLVWVSGEFELSEFWVIEVLLCLQVLKENCITSNCHQNMQFLQFLSLHTLWWRQPHVLQIHVQWRTFHLRSASMFETLFIQVTQRATKICYCERLVIRVLNNPWDTYNALEHQNPDFQKVDSTILLQWITIRKTNNYNY